MDISSEAFISEGVWKTEDEVVGMRYGVPCSNHIDNQCNTAFGFGASDLLVDLSRIHVNHDDVVA